MRETSLEGKYVGDYPLASIYLTSEENVSRIRARERYERRIEDSIEWYSSIIECATEDREPKTRMEYSRILKSDEDNIEYLNY